MKDFEEYKEFSFKSIFTTQKQYRISADLFFKHTRVIGAIGFFTNSLLIFTFYYFRNHLPIYSYIILSLLFIFNSLLVFTFSSYTYYRIIDRWHMYNKIKRFFFNVIFLLPFIGIYFYVVLSLDENEKSWTLKKHFLVGCLFSVILNAIFCSINFVNYKYKWNYLSGNLNFTTMYVTKIYDETNFITEIRERRCQKEFDNYESLNCFLKVLDEEFLKRSFTSHGKILALMLGDYYISHDFDNLVVYPELVSGLQNYKQVYTKLNLQLKLESYKLQNIFTISFPYGLALMDGSVEIPLLLIIDEVIENSTRKHLELRVLPLIQRLKGFLIKLKSRGLAEEQFTHYQNDVDHLEKGFKEIFSTSYSR